ncbi:MAG TPA: hypothetical protein ENI81_04140 [Phycisphaerales bacterium]|nr:hypothetical protein [Phycisphaerales bacterium]
MEQAKIRVTGDADLMRHAPVGAPGVNLEAPLDKLAETSYITSRKSNKQMEGIMSQKIMEEWYTGLLRRTPEEELEFWMRHDAHLARNRTLQRLFRGGDLDALLEVATDLQAGAKVARRRAQKRMYDLDYAGRSDAAERHRLRYWAAEHGAESMSTIIHLVPQIMGGEQ